MIVPNDFLKSSFSEHVNAVTERAFCAFEERMYEEGFQMLEMATAELTQMKMDDNGTEDDNYFNALYVLETVLRFFTNYGAFWRFVLAHEFSNSWRSLQDTLDSLRRIKMFSSFETKPFEDQLLSLENGYPYHIFFSVGMIVALSECSICHEDIDSENCIHRRNNLYRGRIAYGIVRHVTQIDHVSFVVHPEDKRCVVTTSDSSPRFDVIAYVAELINSNQLRISDLASLRYQTRPRKNPSFRVVGRNDKCFCNSGKKFKKCCIEKAFFEGQHVEVIASPGAVRKLSL